MDTASYAQMARERGEEVTEPMTLLCAMEEMGYPVPTELRARLERLQPASEESFDTRFDAMARKQEARLEAEGGFWLSDEDQQLIVAIAEGTVPTSEDEARRWCETHEMRVAPYLIPALWQEIGIELPERRGYDVSGWKFFKAAPSVRIHAVGKTLLEAVARAKVQYDGMKGAP